MTETVSINGKEYLRRHLSIEGKGCYVFELSGSVLENRKHHETEVRSREVQDLFSDNSRTEVSSATHVHDHVFLVDAQGVELVIQLKHWDLMCREGHLLHLAWVDREREGEFWRNDPKAIYNETLDRLTWSPILDDFLFPLGSLTAIGVVAFGVFAVGGAAGAMVGGGESTMLVFMIIGWVILGFLAPKHFRGTRELKSSVERMLRSRPGRGQRESTNLQAEQK